MPDSLVPLAPGGEIASYRLVERLGNLTRSSVWRAVDGRSGREVALKVLTRVMPREATRREAVIREMRLSAAQLSHPGVPTVLDIGVDGDTLFLVMELLEVKPVSRLVPGGPFDRTQVVTIAALVADTLSFFHSKGVVHRNINSDSVMLRDDGHVIIGGLRLQNLLRKEEAPRAAAAEDPFTASYLSPEQILGKPADERSDIFSAGVLLYEVLTGRLPFVGSTAGEITGKIVREQPPSPIAVNPSADRAVMNVIGRSIFKDPIKRYESAKAMLADVRKIEPSVAAALEKNVPSLATTVVAQKAPREVRPAAFLVAAIDGYDAMAASDPERGHAAIEKMQQLAGEAVYLHDGAVADPFASVLIGEFAEPVAATSAARKALGDVAEFNATASPRQQFHLRVAVAMGQSGTRPQKLLDALAQLAPSTLHVEERAWSLSAAERGQAVVIEGFKYIEAKDQEPLTAPFPVAEEVPDTVAPPPPPPARSRWVPIAAISAVVVALLAGAYYLATRPAPEESAPVVAPAPAPAPPQPAAPVTHVVRVAAFSTDLTDPAVLARARRVQLATAELLRFIPRVSIDPAAPDATEFSFTVRQGTAGPELVPRGPSVEGTPVALDSVAPASYTLVTWILQQLKLPVSDLAMPSQEAFDRFADALVAWEEANQASPQAISSIKSSLTADANFLPAQQLAVTIFERAGDMENGFAAANAVLELDPRNLEVLKKAARWAVELGRPVDAVARYSMVLELDPKDWESLNMLGMYALSAGDEAAFQKILKRLDGIPGAPILHSPDSLMYRGAVDRAANAYYPVEEADPTNSAIHLKIGRLAVLRHSLGIAELELGRLRTSDPSYGFSMLEAYVNAEKKNRAAAESALASAIESADWDDQPYTAAAEVYTILADARRSIEALEKAVDRGEPTGAYILNSPLFRYLQNDARFAALREKIQAQQAGVRSELRVAG